MLTVAQSVAGVPMCVPPIKQGKSYLQENHYGYTRPSRASWKTAKSGTRNGQQYLARQLVYHVKNYGLVPHAMLVLRHVRSQLIHYLSLWT